MEAIKYSLVQELWRSVLWTQETLLFIVLLQQKDSKYVVTMCKTLKIVLLTEIISLILLPSQERDGAVVGFFPFIVTYICLFYRIFLINILFSCLHIFYRFSYWSKINSPWFCLEGRDSNPYTWSSCWV